MNRRTTNEQRRGFYRGIIDLKNTNSNSRGLPLFCRSQKHSPERDPRILNFVRRKVHFLEVSKQKEEYWVLADELLFFREDI